MNRFLNLGRSYERREVLRLVVATKSLRLLQRSTKRDRSK